MLDVDVELQGTTDVDIQVSYSVTGGTATEGADYTLPAVRTLTFPADPNNTPQIQSLPITITDDVEVEDTGVAPPIGVGDTENVIITLDTPLPDDDVTLGPPSSATVYILDNDDIDTPDPNGPLPEPEIDPSYEERYFQTGGQRSEGEWYIEAHQDHELEITIPADWPAVQPVSFDLYSPGVHQSTGNGKIDEIDGVYDTTATYTLTLKGNATPEFGTPKVYAPDNTITNSVTNAASWDRLATIPGNQAAGNTYVLRATVESPTEAGRDTNGWGLYVGYDDDGDITTPPIDEGTTGDPIKIGIVRSSLQYTLPDTDVRCQVLYQDVDSSDFVPRNGLDTIAFHNFDIEGFNAEVWYYSPDDTVYRGTWQNEQWNGPDGTSTARGEGDIIYNPAIGQWRLVTCTSRADQYTQEGITGKPTYFTPDGRLP
jgi:hypothetical protein